MSARTCDCDCDTCMGRVCVEAGYDPVDGSDYADYDACECECHAERLRERVGGAVDNPVLISPPVAGAPVTAAPQTPGSERGEEGTR